MVSLEFFIDLKSFRSHYGPGVDSASNINEYQEHFLGGKGGRCVRLTNLPPSCAVVMKSGNLNFLEPSGPLQACNGTAFPYLYTVNTQQYITELIYCCVLTVYNILYKFFTTKRDGPCQIQSKIRFYFLPPSSVTCNVLSTFTIRSTNP